MSELQSTLSFRIDLDQPVVMTPMRQPLISGDQAPCKLLMSFYHSGEGPLDMRQIGMQAYMIRADGTTVVISDGVTTLYGGELTLPESCCAVPGRFTLTVKLTNDTQRRTVLWLEGSVAQSRTDTLVDPGTHVPTVDNVLAKINSMDVAITNANMAASRAVTATTNANNSATRVLKAPFTTFCSDATVEAEHGWSSLRIVEALCPLMTRQGTSVTVTDALGGSPLSVRAAMEPQQSGAGAPSPSNIRPLAAPAQLTLTRNEETYTVALPEGFGGGWVDVTGGSVGTEWLILTLDGSETWTADSTGNQVRFTLPLTSAPLLSDGVTWLCSHYASASPEAQAGMSCAILATEDGAALSFTDSLYVGTDAWREYLTARYAEGQPVTVCYRLAKPTVTETEPVTLTAHPAANTLQAADAHPLTVTYRGDAARLLAGLLTAASTQTEEETP